MADDLSRRNGQERGEISLTQPYGVRDWTEHFGVTDEQLGKAVAAVSHSAERVREHLKR